MHLLVLSSLLLSLLFLLSCTITYYHDHCKLSHRNGCGCVIITVVAIIIIIILTIIDHYNSLYRYIIITQFKNNTVFCLCLFPFFRQIRAYTATKVPTCQPSTIFAIKLNQATEATKLALGHFALKDFKLNSSPRHLWRHFEVQVILQAPVLSIHQFIHRVNSYQFVTLGQIGCVLVGNCDIQVLEEQFVLLATLVLVQIRQRWSKLQSWLHENWEGKFFVTVFLRKRNIA